VDEIGDRCTEVMQAVDFELYLLKLDNADVAVVLPSRIFDLDLELGAK
jgi:hypothetical protein